MASNRAGNIRNVKDNVRGKVIGLPVSSKKVTRRVTPDLVSTYHMKVHERPAGGSSDFVNLVRDRNKEPGEIELTGLDRNSRSLVDYLTAHNKISDMFAGDRRRQIGEYQSSVLASAAFGKFLKEDRFEQALDFTRSSGFNMEDLRRISASSWRHFIKNAPLEIIDDLARKQFPNSIFLGELSVLSNTLLRRGRNTLNYILPATQKLTKGIEFVDLPHQQLFNMSGMTLPSRVEPINKNHINVVDTAGAKWVYNKARRSNWIRNFLQAHDGMSLRVMLHGFPAKTDSAANILQISSRGLYNSQIQINPDDILGILGGFSIGVRKIGAGVEEELNEVRMNAWPQNSLVFPIIEDELDPIASNVRGRIIKFSNKTSSVNDITTSAINVGAGEHGISELDIRDNGHYTWDNSRPNNPRPYRSSNETDIFTTSYPHPLVKYTAMQYLGNTDPSILKMVGDMSVVTLPRQHLKQNKKSKL